MSKQKKDTQRSTFWKVLSFKTETTKQYNRPKAQIF